MKKSLITKIISAIFSLIILIAVAIGAILYFGLFEELTNAVIGMYHVNQGDKAYRKHNIPQAIVYYKKGLDIYPKHYEAWTNLGNIYVVYEDYYSAVNAYEQAIKHKPTYTLARMNYGVIATEKLGDFEQAIKQFQSIIDSKQKTWVIPFIFNSKKSERLNKGIAYYNMGVAYRQKAFYESENLPLAEKDLQSAIRAYEKALKVMPKDYNTIFNLASAYHADGDTKKSAKMYCKAIALEPMNYEAHYNLAILLRHLKMYREAYGEIEKASLLATERGDVNSNSQSYVLDILNDMSMTLISYNMLDKGQEDDKYQSSVTYVKGKLVATDELDKAILNNFKKCEAQDYINEE
ncbi:tetratricopeptide repeat protein [bacterium]|nr:tetratricopeptide repeat protein [bacterium]